MTIKIYYETLDGKKRYSSSEMKKTKGDTYFDYIAVFKRCDDKIKEDFVIIVYNKTIKVDTRILSFVGQQNHQKQNGHMALLYVETELFLKQDMGILFLCVVTNTGIYIV